MVHPIPEIHLNARARGNDIINARVADMSTFPSTALVTPEELLAMPDGVDFELVDGRLVERHMGMESSEIAMRIAILIGMFVRQNHRGHVFGPDASYRCFPANPGKVRRPDVSFIAPGRLPFERAPRGHCLIAPDLAVEVLSPGDHAYDVGEKIAEYLAAGVKLIWVVHPATRTVEVRRPATSAAGRISELTADDAITGEDVLEGFACKVKEFFE
jgi:Uma2 family endonuclease